MWGGMAGGCDGETQTTNRGFAGLGGIGGVVVEINPQNNKREAQKKTNYRELIIAGSHKNQDRRDNLRKAPFWRWKGIIQGQGGQLMLAILPMLGFWGVVPHRNGTAGGSVTGKRGQREFEGPGGERNPGRNGLPMDWKEGAGGRARDNGPPHKITRTRINTSKPR